MKRAQNCFLSLILTAFLSVGCNRTPADSEHHDHDHLGHHDEAPDFERGPHGGRMLRDGHLGLEVAIFERGVPPEFRIFTYADEGQIDPASVKLTIELHRVGGRTDSISFTKRDDYLLGDKEIVEPHSFDVRVSAEYKGKSFRWEYASYEGRTEITPEVVTSSGISIETAGPATIRSALPVTGLIVPNGDRLARVIPRYPGIIREVHKRQGDAVQKNDLLAVVESNESLRAYEVRSPIFGTVIEKSINAGEYSPEGNAAFTIADLSTVWVELTVYRKDIFNVRIGQRVEITADDGRTTAESRLKFVSPFGSEHTQSSVARAELDNAKGHWTIGVFVNGSIVIEEVSVPVAVKASGIQTFRDWNVVFAQDGDVFEIAILELGRRDREWIEVLDGIKPGQKYAAENSFIIKADIGKSGASHDH